jgi:hypothetical protein
VNRCCLSSFADVLPACRCICCCGWELPPDGCKGRICVLIY